MSAVAALAGLTACSSDGTASVTTTTAPATTASTASTTTTPAGPTTTGGPATTVTVPDPVLAAPTSRIALPDGYEYPEGIDLDPATGVLYAGTVFGGAIATVSPDGSVTELIPANADGRTIAIGLAVGADRLWIAGGFDSTLYEYELDGTFVGRHVAAPAAGVLNEVVVTDEGVFVTDSTQRTLWRLPAGAAADAPLEPAIDLAAQGVEYVADAYNWNGIEQLPDGTLITVQTATGQMYAIDPMALTVREIPTTGDSLVDADAFVVFDEDTLFVNRNASDTIARVDLCPELACAEVTTALVDETLDFPTGITRRGDELVVVAAQFDKGGPIGPGTPSRPFVLSVVPIR
jgi:Cu-Zn family superoxide dismutase